MKYHTSLRCYRLIAETEEDKKFLEFLNNTFENCATEKERYWRPALVKATSIGTDNNQKYMDFEVKSLFFKIVKPIELEIIVDDEISILPLISRLVLTPIRKKD